MCLIGIKLATLIYPMKRLTTLLALTFISALTLAQCNGRYQTEIFSSVTKTTVNYSDVYNDNAHSMDIYIADGDAEINRPVIIYMHGGSFLGGDKSAIDCVDFCESFAKKGYVTASANYRLANDAQSFALYQEEQYTTVLKVVSDIKGAIRYFRKSLVNGNPYGIDGNAIFIGGYSAGAVAAIHSAYIDSISDLPVSITYIDILTGQSVDFNPQNLVNTIGGNLEGDAGNYGFSSEVSGVISFAGGINDINWIDSYDEPIVSCQGDADQIVNYNCGPGLNIPTVFTLCGAAEIHPKANIEGVINDYLVLTGEGHEWCSAGNNSPLFSQALDFTSAFLFPLLPCNNITSISEENARNKQLIRITDMIGRNTSIISNSPLFYIYGDGSVENKIILN